MDNGHDAALQVPRHEFRVVEDAGKETVEIKVHLPGVASASEVQVSIKPPHTVTVLVPGRYYLKLGLAVPIAPHADLVKFRPKSEKLTMNCRVVIPPEPGSAGSSNAGSSRGGSSSSSSNSDSDSDSRPAVASKDRPAAAGGGVAAASAPSSTASCSSSVASSSGGSSGGHHQHKRCKQIRLQRQEVHESFFPQPTKAELKRQQQAEQARLKQQQEEEAAAAAAEAERQRQMEEAAAAAAAQREAEEREAAARAAKAKRRAEAAAAARAAAAEEAQRKEQQRRLNMAAAEEWIRRGEAAVSQGDVEAACKALSKAQELDPANTHALDQLTRAINTLQNPHGSSSSSSESPQQQQGGPAARGSGGGAARPPPRKPQQPVQRLQWQLSMAADMEGLLGTFAAGGHARSVVGWWCALLVFICYWVTRLGLSTAHWAGAGVSVLSGVRYTAPLRLYLLVVQCLAGWLAKLPLLLLVAWHTAWVTQLRLGYYLRRLGGDTPDEATSWFIKRRQALTASQALLPAALKLLLAFTSAAVVWGVVWCTFCVNFDLDFEEYYEWHTLFGWAWKALMWDTNYTVQLLAAGGTSLVCFSGSTKSCQAALVPLQVLLTAGGKFATVSLVLSTLATFILQRRRSRRQAVKPTALWSLPLAPQWQAVVAGVLPAQLTYLLVRTKNWRTFCKGVKFLVKLGGTFCCMVLTCASTGVFVWLYGLAGVVKEVLVFSLALLTCGPLSFLAAPVDLLLAGVTWIGTAVGLLAQLLAGLLGVLVAPLVVLGYAASSILANNWDMLDDATYKWRYKVYYAVVYVVWPFLPPSLSVDLAGRCWDDVLMMYFYDPDYATAGCTALSDAAYDSLFVTRRVPHSWWFDLLPLVWLGVLVAVIIRRARRGQRGWQGFRSWFRFRSRSKAKHGAGSHGAGAGESDAEEGDDDVSDEASRFPMGFGAVPVPVGCEVAAVKAVLQAADYYQVMGFTSSSAALTADTLKAKRRQLVLAVHPDKVGHSCPGANLAAGRVNKAFETLSDPATRTAYDTYLNSCRNGSGNTTNNKGSRRHNQSWGGDAGSGRAGNSGTASNSKKQRRKHR